MVFLAVSCCLLCYHSEGQSIFILILLFTSGLHALPLNSNAKLFYRHVPGNLDYFILLRSSEDVITPSTAFYTVTFSEYQCFLGLQAWVKSSWLTHNPQLLKHSLRHLGGAVNWYSEHWYSESTRRYSFAFLIQIKFSVEAPTAGLI